MDQGVVHFISAGQILAVGRSSLTALSRRGRSSSTHVKGDIRPFDRRLKPHMLEPDEWSARMRWLAVAVIGSMVGVTQLTGCTRAGDGVETESPSPPSPTSSAASNSAATSTANSPSTTPSSASSSPQESPRLPAGFSTSPKKGGTPPARAELLRLIRSGRHVGYDRIVFEFTGSPPAYDVRYVDQVRQDPSDRPVRLQGTAFLSVVMPGGTLDTTLQVDDPAKAQSYKGPRRLQPDLSAVQEIAVAGDFEGVLSFGVGLDRRSAFRVLRLSDPARIVIDVATA